MGTFLYRKYKRGIKESSVSSLFLHSAKNCSKIVACTVKIVKFVFCIISEQPWKAISLMFKTKTVGPCLFQKFAPALPSGYDPGMTKLLCWLTLWLGRWLIWLYFILQKIKMYHLHIILYWILNHQIITGIE